ncbi:hypothetical protein QAD02_002575 [Eretmocerus hayati]|uniref:Uncharacterized protein n=1 Tax=Eretmocerus hayati TaxID=131215 RepID=A0ACC2NJQ0_9HYME|nr:hypothetical protein QAD02_002575 [Eretmocerus hayati]
MPANAVSAEYYAQNPGAIRGVMQSFPRALHRVDAELIEDEWDRLLQHHPILQPGMKIDTFWDEVREFRVPQEAQDPNPDQGAILINLGQFAMNILAMSHSNAEAERGFSAGRLVWTRLGVNLDLSTTEGVLLMRNCNRIHGFHRHAARFQPTDRMIQLIRERRYNHPNRARQLGEDSDEDGDSESDADGDYESDADEHAA